jgi:hypothetical protein
MRSAFGWLFVLVLLAAAALFLRDYVRTHPQDVPWTRLNLTDPVGAFTGRKLTALARKPGECRALLVGAGTDDDAVPPVSAGPDCGYDDGMRLGSGGRVALYAPALVTSCPVAAALYVLERDVIEPAARRHFDSEVTAIEHFGSYSCRRIYGREGARFSEHATADAVDISAFRLADGRRIRVVRDWVGDGPEAAFLREVRDGACDLFATVLSPDYNEAHADHLHLDQADRGAWGFRLCR